MKGVIHGILRCLLTLGGCYLFYFFIIGVPDALRYYHGPYLIRTLVFGQLILCFIVYMSINSLREFMRKRITLRVLYVIMALITIVLIAVAVFDFAGRSFDKPPPASDIIAYLAMLVMLYFTISDFIQLFVKKKEERVYTDADFEAADRER